MYKTLGANIFYIYRFITGCTTRIETKQKLHKEIKKGICLMLTEESDMLELQLIDTFQFGLKEALLVT